MRRKAPPNQLPLFTPPKIEQPDLFEGNRIMEEIMFYLQDHPDAKDTLEGITESWVNHIPQAKVENAVEILLMRKEIMVEVAADGKKIYRGLNREEEIRKLKTEINSTESLIRMMQGNTDPDWLKKLEREMNGPKRERIEELDGKK